jgi:acyl-coenzyme A synthetase/AMP-(fatty) acid ligase
MVTFCAMVLRGQVNLLPPSRAPLAVRDVMANHPGCYAVGEQRLEPAPAGYRRLPPLAADALASAAEAPMVRADQLVAIGYTSGSTGQPGANAKSWRSFRISTAANLERLQALVDREFDMVATVPPQHMYGMEMSVLLPLLAQVSVHAGRPFFAGDIVAALAAMARPPVLVTTPVHLRVLIESGLALPPIAAIVSATAPLSTALAQVAEQRFGAPVLELFGSTESCVFASRRTAREQDWALYPGVTLSPRPDGTQVNGPQLAAAVTLADIVELSSCQRRFALKGRHADMLEIAGKRTSLGDLTCRLLAVPGVVDGVVFQLDAADALGIHRVAALVVAPGLTEGRILEQLRGRIDPLFLPRPLRLVEALPRNETGKLPRAALLERLHQRD